MSRRGLRTGIITTYLHTWLLQTDGLGNLKISPAIRHDTLGTPTTASVTEVREGASAAYMHDYKKKQKCCRLFDADNIRCTDHLMIACRRVAA